MLLHVLLMIAGIETNPKTPSTSNTTAAITGINSTVNYFKASYNKVDRLLRSNAWVNLYKPTFGSSTTYKTDLPTPPEGIELICCADDYLHLEITSHKIHIFGWVNIAGIVILDACMLFTLWTREVNHHQQSTCCVGETPKNPRSNFGPASDQSHHSRTFHTCSTTIRQVPQIFSVRPSGSI